MVHRMLSRGTKISLTNICGSETHGKRYLRYTQPDWAGQQTWWNSEHTCAAVHSKILICDDESCGGFCALLRAVFLGRGVAGVDSDADGSTKTKGSSPVNVRD